jgi:type IV pilus assembly protein PilP
LIGCHDKHGDLKKYVDSVKTRQSGTVEQIPVIPLYTPFKYKAAHLRSPFAPEQKTILNTIRPDLQRKKQLLETFPLDSLKMVGTFLYNKQFWALIEAPDHTVHKVIDGDYLGKDFGKIIKITPDTVILTETVADGRGGWIERNTVISFVKK